jgi:alkylation response protein AidB-like acyl-CoA dehydrogenase
MQRLFEICGVLSRDSVAMVDDPGVRQKLGRMLVEVEVLRYAGYRILSKLEQGKRPGAESSVDKLYYSELDKRHQELIQDILGPFGQLERGLPSELGLNSSTMRGDDATWAYNFLWSRAGTIYAGSSEIQKNIIGERVLKLPREPRADRATSTGKGA